MIDQTICRHCGVGLPPKHDGRGRQRMFCSDTCRVKFGYRRKVGVTTNRQRAERMGKGPFTPTLTEPEKAWLAAMIDGEGCISLAEHRKRARGQSYYFPDVTFNNTNTLLCDEFRRLVGMHHTRVQTRAPEGRFKTRYAVKVDRSAIAGLLEQITPYLIAKREQARLVIEVCKTHDDLPVRTPPLERFTEVWGIMRALNKRGTG